MTLENEEVKRITDTFNPNLFIDLWIEVSISREWNCFSDGLLGIIYSAREFLHSYDEVINKSIPIFYRNAFNHCSRIFI